MLELLRLLQLADSALPIGTSAHSFGLETLTAEGELTPDGLSSFFADLLAETGPLEATYCRRGYRVAERYRDEESTGSRNHFASEWIALNQALSARKTARESRNASTTLGKRFLRLVAGLEPQPWFEEALRCWNQSEPEIHHCLAFGLVGGFLNLDEENVVVAYLQQNLSGMVSACQRLMSVGQMQANVLVWQLNPHIIRIAAQSQADECNKVYTFAPYFDLAGMRHASLPVRLFIS